MKAFKPLLFSFGVGMTIGGLMAISIRYPVTAKNIESAAKTCETHKGLEVIKVGISGKVYQIRCYDRMVFNFR